MLSACVLLIIFIYIAGLVLVDFHFQQSVLYLLRKEMSISHEDRCIGSLLGHMIGDQLGAAVEGFSAARIKREHGIVRDDIETPHMGILELGPRIHMYTDDTNRSLLNQVRR